MMLKPINVVVAIIYNNEHDSVLLSKRRPGSHQAGLWEFPGGKVKDGESDVSALKREILEEIGLQIKHAHVLMQVVYEYSDITVRIQAWIVSQWTGSPLGKEGQMVEWFPLNKVSQLPLPAANIKITKALVLPGLYLITPSRESYDEAFISLVDNLASNGLSFLQFRSKESTYRQHKSLVMELVQVCNSHGCKLIYNGTVEQADSVNAHGVHLNSNELLNLDNRPVPENVWVSASCHNSLELEHARKCDLDFCVVSPVFQSASHPEVRGIGWENFRSIVSGAGIPVFALGGLNWTHLHDARNNGAHGIAMISGVWDAAEPTEVIRKLKHSNF